MELHSLRHELAALGLDGDRRPSFAALFRLYSANLSAEVRPDMGWKRKIHGGVLGFIGFMLSPLSWWNDWFVNIPIALGAGWLAGWIHAPAFLPAVIVTYWLTNIAGFFLMHKGAQKIMGNEEKRYTWRDLARDVCVSMVYTVILVVLVKLKVFGPLDTQSFEKFSPAR